MKIAGILLTFLLISLSIFSISPFHVNVNAQGPQPPIVRQMCSNVQAPSAGNIISCNFSSSAQAGDLLFIVLFGSVACNNTVSDTLSTKFQYVYDCFQPNLPVATLWSGVVTNNGGDTITVSTTTSKIYFTGLELIIYDIGNLNNYYAYINIYAFPPINAYLAGQVTLNMQTTIQVPPNSVAIGIASMELPSLTSCSNVNTTALLTHAGAGTGCFAVNTNIVGYADSFNLYSTSGGNIKNIADIGVNSGTFEPNDGAIDLVFIVENNYTNQPPICTNCPNSGSGNGNAGLGINYLIPITLSNTKNISIPTLFPYPITFNSATFSQYLASNDQNIIFMDSNGYALYAWCESNCTNTATSTLFYVNLGSDTIPAFSQRIIWMGIYSTNFDDRSASGFYGQNPTIGGINNDNGGEVFTIFYDNFSGTTLNTNKWANSNAGAPNIGSYTVNNGITLTTTTTNGIEIHTTSTFVYQDQNHINYTFEWYSAPFTISVPNSLIRFGYTSSSYSPEMLFTGTSNTLQLQYATSSTTTGLTLQQNINDSTGNHLFGIYANGQYVVGTFDYKIICKGATNYIPPVLPIGGQYNYESGATTPTLYFVRDRVMWTNGTAVSIGSAISQVPIICNQSSLTVLGLAIFLAIFFFIWMMYKKAKKEGITKDMIMWVFYFAIIVIILLLIGTIGLTASSQICPASG